MDQQGFCGYSCFPVLKLPENYPKVPAEALSSDHFSIELRVRHETEVEVYNEQSSLLQVQRVRELNIGPKFLLLSCKEVLSENGPLLLKRAIFNYECMPESFIGEAATEILNFCRVLFDTNEVNWSRKPAEDRRHRPRGVILPMRIRIFVLTIQTQIFEFTQEFRTVPASEEAIESLEKVNYSHEGSVVENEGYCAICLDELSHEGILKMPCSHAYHQDCIVRWLKKSNMCPQCRYQLP